MSFVPPDRVPEYVFLKMKTLTPQDLVRIEADSHALDLQQCFDNLMVNPDCLTEEELYYANHAHRKGQAQHIAIACTRLFDHMKTKNGGVSALEYLRAKQGNFTATAKVNTNSDFRFNIQLQ